MDMQLNTSSPAGVGVSVEPNPVRSPVRTTRRVGVFKRAIGFTIWVGSGFGLLTLLLRGKGKPSFVNNMDCGDHVVIINAKSLVLTGNKLQDKAFHHYSGFAGGLKTVMVKDLMKEKPEEVIIHAVKGMLPKNKLQNEFMKRLHVYASAEHPHQANVATSK